MANQKVHSLLIFCSIRLPRYTVRRKNKILSDLWNLFSNFVVENGLACVQGVQATNHSMSLKSKI